MRKVRFTKPKVAALRPAGARYDVHDDGGVSGLVVTVHPSGVRVWYVVRKVRGRVERVRIGRVEDVPPEAARKKAAKINATIADGKSPSEERRAVRAEMTLGELWTLFLERHAKPHKRSWRTDQHRWKRHLAHWSGRKLSAIDRPAVVRLLDAITASSGPGAANRTRALLCTMFGLARAWGADVANPVAGSPRNAERPKQRFLLADELRRFLAAVDEDHDDDTRDFLKLLLFTGVRRGSLSTARWEDLAMRDAFWTVPGEHMKSGRPLELPLAPAAAAIFRERQERAAPGAVWVFPGRSDGHTTGPDVGFARVLERAEIAGVTMHDLRRTFAVYSQESGVQLAIVARLLGHGTVGGITGKVYALVTPSAVRAGVERTVRYLLRVAAGTAKVIPFAAVGKP